MLARFTFSVIVPKYGVESWVLSQNDQCGNGKDLVVEDSLYIYIFIYFFFFFNFFFLFINKYIHI